MRVCLPLCTSSAGRTPTLRSVCPPAGSGGTGMRRACHFLFCLGFHLLVELEPALGALFCILLRGRAGATFTLCFCRPSTWCTTLHVVRAKSCPTLCSPVDCSPPGSSVHGILQARILEWVAISCSRGSSRPRDGTRVSYVPCSGRWVLYHYRQRGALADSGYSVNIYGVIDQTGQRPWKWKERRGW